MELNEPELAYKKESFSIEEYLQMENTSEEKHEYYKGEIFAMSGAKIMHNIVSKNIISALDKRMDDSPCQPYNSDTRIYIKKKSLFTYPDISIICGEPVTLDDDEFNVLNPTVIFEVLSTSTKDYNKVEKFRLYRDIPTLREYILVDPDTIFIEAFHINENGFWELREYQSVEDTLPLQTVSVSLPLREIYKRTKCMA